MCPGTCAYPRVCSSVSVCAIVCAQAHIGVNLPVFIYARCFLTEEAGLIHNVIVFAPKSLGNNQWSGFADTPRSCETTMSLVRTIKF